MKYLKVWTSFLDLMQSLQHDEVGRLFEMMLRYADNGEEPCEFEGNERFLWPVAKQQIDMASERNEKLRENGLKGGRPKTKDNQTKPNETKDNQTKAVKKSNVIESNVKENTIPSVSLKEPMIADADAQKIQREQDRILSMAENAGFSKSPMVTARIVDFYAEYGEKKLADAIGECVTHGVTNLAYLSAVLKGSGGAKKPSKTVAAQEYDQRSYKDIAAEIEAQQNARIMERLRQEGRTI